MKSRQFSYLLLSLSLFFGTHALADNSTPKEETPSVVSQLTLSSERLQELSELYKEDDYYQVLDSKHSNSPQITQYFSVFCGHCRKFEDTVSDMLTELPQGLTFNKKHISWMGRQLGPLMTKAVVTAQQLGIEDRIIPALFVQNQDKEAYLFSDADVRDFFIKNGVSEQDFDNTYNNVITLAMAKNNDQSFLDLKLRAVPALIVNNKYLVQPKRDFDPDQYAELVTYLLNK